MPVKTAAQKTEPVTSYDEVPYESYSYVQTHPAHMATIARLFGLNPPDFKKARVLELGCASGGNLLPLALLYPNASFTGLDLSQEQIAEANEGKKALKLKNIDFKQQDITTFDFKAHAGQFDYIIAHGVFSWVPEPVREKILELCQSCLSPDGLALISYNTLPGWNAVRSLREMMQYHISRFPSPAEKVKQARALLEFLSESVPEGRAGWREVIEEERRMLRNVNDSYLFHDHLENNNTQFYLHDFARMAMEHDLAYVGDSNLASMFVGNMPKKALDVLRSVNDIVRQEQYMDFITNRRFRTSILCRKGAPLSRALSPTRIMDFHLTSNMKPEAANADPKKDIVFKTANGAIFTTHTEIAAHLHITLSESGMKPVAARDLVASVQKKMKMNDSAAIEKTLIQHGMQLALHGYISLHSASPDFVALAGKKPEAFAMARYQAGMKSCHSVTNTLGAMVTTDSVANIVINHLDGTRTAGDIADLMSAMAMEGKITISHEGKPTKDATLIREEIARVVEQIISKVAAQALLVKA